MSAPTALPAPALMSLCLVYVVSLAGCRDKERAPAEPQAATARSLSRQPAKKRRVVIGITQEPSTLFLPFKDMRAAELVAKTGSYALTVYDADKQLQPWAATSIPTLGNGGVVMLSQGDAQRMQVTWRLADRFAWPDGKPLSADDFVFTWEMSKDDRLPILDRSSVDRILSMTSSDAGRTLTVVFKEPYAYYASYDNHFAVPRHLVEPLYRKNPGRVHESTFGQRPALAGAFTVQEWVVGSHITLRRNPALKPPFAPHLDEVIWRFVPQTQAMESHLLSGSVDIVSPIGFTLDQAIAFEKRHGDAFDVHFTPALFWEHIDLKHEHPAFADVRVRRALLHAIDRAALVRELFNDRQQVAHGTVPPGATFHEPKVRRYPFDPALAGRLFDEAGWRRGEDGVRTKDGVRLSVPFLTTAGDRLRLQVQQLLQAWWRDAGVEVRIANQPARILFGESVRHRKYEGMVMFSWSMMPDVPNRNLWRCDGVPSADNGWDGQNIPGWCHEEADRLLREAARSIDREQHDELMRGFERIFAEELPALPLYYRAEISVTRKGFEGWRPTGTFQSVGWNAHEWRWR